MNVFLLAQHKTSVHIRYVQAREDWAGKRRSLAKGRKKNRRIEVRRKHIVCLF